MNYPIHLISLGAGVQSSTVHFMAEDGLILPRPAASIFGDTKDEPRSVYDWLNWIESRSTIRILRVTKGSLSESATHMKRTADGRLYSKTDIPFFTLSKRDGSRGKIKQRGCTRDFKIGPLIEAARLMVGKAAMNNWRRKHRPALKLISAWKDAPKDRKPPYPHDAWKECQSDPLVVQWIGISVDEISRMKPSRDPWILCRWPLIEMGMSRHDCLRWMAERGHPEPPRSACVYCPFHSNAEWRRLRDEEPEEFQKAVDFEKKLQAAKAGSYHFQQIPFLHRSCKPLDQIEFKSTEEINEERGQINMFENECEGMCGV